MDEHELQAIVDRKRAQQARGAQPMADALRKAAASVVAPVVTESPIERDFYAIARERIAELQSQVVIGPYRVDFAIVPKRLVVELDGHQFHATVEQRTADAKRARRLLAMGWHVVRFTGTEIRRGVHRCVDEVLEILEALP